MRKGDVMRDFAEFLETVFKKNRQWETVYHYITTHYFAYLITLVLLGALILRVFQASIGLPYLYFWDEPQTASTALRMMKTGDYNPHFFNYGSLMIYLNMLVDRVHYAYLTMLAPGSSGYLKRLKDIRINTDTGWPWTISHPSFYFWNRFLTALMSTGTVFAAYLMGRAIFNKWAGMISAVFLASLPIHIAYSGFVTPDAPVAFFVALVALFSVLFIEEKKMVYFVLSLVCVGFTTAVKYNAGIALLMPFASLVWMSKKNEIAVEKFHWLMIAVIPTITFFVSMPYALLDFPDFINNVLDEMKHYAIMGHPKATSTPGWGNFSYQMHQFYENIGLSGTLLVLIGLVGVFFRPLFLLTLILPVAYILFMSTMKVNFHRNFVLVYPFIALVTGAAFYNLNSALNFLFFKFNRKEKKISIVCTGVIAALFLIPQVYAANRDGIERYHARDTRSTVIDTINALKNIKKVIIAKELKVHTQDLCRLTCDYAIQPIELMSLKEDEDGAVYVLPSTVSQLQAADYYRDEIRIKQSIIDRVNRDDILREIKSNYAEGHSATMLDVFSTSPSLMIVKRVAHMPLRPDVIAFDTCQRSYAGTWMGVNNELTLGDGVVTTSTYHLERGAYQFVFEAAKPVLREKRAVFTFGAYETEITVKHVRTFAENPKIKVSVFGDHVLLAEKIFDPIENFTAMSASFSLTKDRDVAVRIENVHPVSHDGLREETRIRHLKISAEEVRQ